MVIAPTVKMPAKVGKAKVRPKKPKAFFLGYQERWITDNARLKLMEKGRQIGLSLSAAYRLVKTVCAAEAKHDAWVSSRDELQARLFLEDCNAFAAILNTAANDLGERIVDEGSRASAFVLEFANGKRIYSMSSNPDAQAGKRGTRLLDEFALHPDQRKLYSIAYPGITWGGQLEMISTHRGSDSFFAKLVQEARHGGNPKKISLHRVTLEDALADGFLWKLQVKLIEGGATDSEILDLDEAGYVDFVRGGCADEETYMQEYMCVPADDAAAFLEYALIDSCEYARGEIWETPLDRSQNPLYLGVDVGRKKDLTVLWLLEEMGGVQFTRRVIELQNTRFSQQEEILYPLLAHPRLQRCCIDATGLGMQLAERAQERFGSYRVEAVNFSPAVKEELAYPLRGAFEDRTVRIPGSPEIRRDLRAVRKETTASGNIRFTADTGPDGHSDRFWGLALALHAGKRGGAVGAAAGVRVRRGRERAIF